MRILVASDTHGNFALLRCAVTEQPTAAALIHLGDGERDVQQLRFEFPELDVYQVRGNCDYNSKVPDKLEITLAQKKIFITHGHLYNVKSSLYSIYSAGRELGTDIVLFGHTHLPTTIYQDGIYMMNPGSLKGYNASYGIVDITNAGIVTNIIELNKKSDC